MTDYNYRDLCAELVEAWDTTSDFDYNDFGNLAKPLVARARYLLSEPVTVRPTQRQLMMLSEDMGMASVGDAALYAREVLARWGNHSPADTKMVIPAKGEVAELVRWLRDKGRGAWPPPDGLSPSAQAEEYEFYSGLTRAAELLERLARQTLPQGMIPMEYVDADSSARIVSEPSEGGSGGCWVVRNTPHVNPYIEFSTAEAAWDALQRAQSLPLPAPQGGKVVGA